MSNFSVGNFSFNQWKELKLTKEVDITKSKRIFHRKKDKNYFKDEKKHIFVNKVQDQLKGFILEDWNSIPISMIQNLYKGYIEILKKVIELNERKLEPEQLYKSTNNVYNRVIPENLPKFRYVYNDAKVKQYKDIEIKRLNIELKTLISSFNQKIKLRIDNL